MPQPTRESKASTPELVAGLVADAKDLAGAHLERIRDEIRDEVHTFTSTLKEIAIAVGVIIVAAVLAGHAIALGLAAAGLPIWLAYAIIAAVATAVGVAILLRPRPSADLVPEQALAAAKEDASRLARQASDVLDGD
jgi:hypothetical protein